MPRCPQCSLSELVLTNDGFRDHVAKGVISQEWCNARLVPYTWLLGTDLLPTGNTAGLL